jgi:hypothetical protein
MRKNSTNAATAARDSAVRAGGYAPYFRTFQKVEVDPESCRLFAARKWPTLQPS